uniref:Uncharacterized protein n=1 Tax=Pararge aegeria TaxID=116150 RepID=S4NMI4_9NEOP
MLRSMAVTLNPPFLFIGFYSTSYRHFKSLSGTVTSPGPNLPPDQSTENSEIIYFLITPPGIGPWTSYTGWSSNPIINAMK